VAVSGAHPDALRTVVVDSGTRIRIQSLVLRAYVGTRTDLDSLGAVFPEIEETFHRPEDRSRSMITIYYYNLKHVWKIFRENQISDQCRLIKFSVFSRVP
jgi:hypothetical protein